MLHKPELYLAPKILKNPEWFYVKSICDITLHKVGIHYYYILKYKNPTRFELHKIRNISKTEKFYCNNYLEDDYFCCKFSPRDAEAILFDTYIKLGINYIGGRDINGFTTFLNNKKPQLLS